jgi:fermentation-respiration switch protein FrsA (DUF1100 family)
MSGGAVRGKIAFLCFVSALSSGCIVRSVEDRFIFFPTRQLVGSPSDVGLDYTAVHLTADDGTRLHGWWVPADPERAVLLFLHGNAGNISDRVESIQTFHDLGLSVFIFDYRGYGESSGSPSEKGTYADAEAAWRYLKEERGIAPERIVIFGRSLGGAVACDLAIRHPPRALVLESTFTSIRDMAAAAMPLLPVGPFLRTRYDTLSKIRRITVPVLVVHSSEDEVVPYRQGVALYDAAPPPKAFVELRYGHNEGFILSGETYTKGVDTFLTAHVAPPPPPPKQAKRTKAESHETAAAEEPAAHEQPASPSDTLSREQIEEPSEPDAEQAPDAEAPPDTQGTRSDEPPILD